MAEYGDGTTYFIHRDHLSSTRLVTKLDGSIKDSYDYLPFGQLNTSVAGGNSILHLFTGKEHDAETATGIGAQDGFDYFGARYYASRNFRFMSPDPSNLNADLVDSENPQAWNMYSYVVNNPLNAVDPDGLDYWLIGGDLCGQNNVQCDNAGFVLDNNGSRVVITDQQLNGSNGLAEVDENGNLQIKTDQGTFQGQFFDPNIDANGKAIIPQAVVTPAYSDMLFDAVARGVQMARPGVNAAVALTAPQYIFMAGTTVALSGASETTIFTPTEGQAAHVSRILAQGGRRALQQSIRSWQKSLAEHMAKLEQYRNAGTPTSDIVRTINNLKSLIQAAQNLLAK